MQSANPDEDRISWPPVIARIRDLDKPVTPSNPAALPTSAPETRMPLESVREKNSPRPSQKFSSRLIAVAGIVIFLLAIVPFLRSRDHKTATETSGTALPSASPAPNAGLAPIWVGGTTSAGDPTGKTSSRPTAVPSASLTNKSESTAAPTPGVPPLLPAPEKKASPESSLVNPLPPKGMNALADTPKEQIAIQPATQPADVRGDASTPTIIPGINGPAPQPRVEIHQVTEVGEFSPFPKVRAEKVEAANTDRGPFRASPELSNALPPSAPTGLGAPVAMPNQSPGSGGAAMQGMADANATSPYAPPAATSIPGAVNRENLQADARNDVRRRYQYEPDYRRKPPVESPVPPSTGQALPPNGPPPSPPGPAGAIPPRTPPSYDPNRPAASANPTVQPASSSSLPGTAAPPQNRVGSPAPAVDGSPPPAVPYGSADSGIVNADGYSIPPVTGSFPRRY
ncbi:MAG: hypothetical protein IT426_08400 [Pirellulales bacterium]|nr:hypothetical protein [Pirellulales bacterium]